jgi:hypothetical protein
MKRLIPFLRRAHFLHAFLVILVLFNVVGNTVIWLSTESADRGVWPVQLMPFVWLLLSLIVAPLFAFTWDDTMQRDAKRAAAWGRIEAAVDGLATQYRNHPDYLGISVAFERCTLHVKAAPYGHPFPHNWDGVPVRIAVEAPDRWVDWGKKQK